MIQAFLPKDKVYIKELGLNGTVLSVLIDGDGTSYKVRFFVEKRSAIDWFYDDELTVIKETV